MGGFEFQLNQKVWIECSMENGRVIARAEYLNSSNQYLLRYKTAVGNAVEEWWDESALVSTLKEAPKKGMPEHEGR